MELVFAGLEVKIPKSKKFKKLLKSTREQYGKKKGEKIAYATAHKLGWRV